MIHFYGYRKCSTSRKAEQFLSGRDIPYTFIDITENPPTEEIFAHILAQSGKELKQFFNTSGIVYRTEGIKDKLATMTDAEKTSLLLSNGKLLKRPIVHDNTRATVGYKPEEFERIWG